MLTRYDAIKDQEVELTQEYFNELQAQFGAMLHHYSLNCNDKFNEFCEEWKSKVNKNA